MEMPFTAKGMAPYGSEPCAAHRVFDDAASAGITVLIAAAGYLLTEGLAAALAKRGRMRNLWLRLGPEDRDPASFLVSMVTAAQRLQPDAGRATLELMRRRPGPIAGWQPLFNQLAADLSAVVDRYGALVLEDVHNLGSQCPTLSLLASHLLPSLAGGVPCILIADDLPATLLGRSQYKYVRELRISNTDAARLVEEGVPGLTGRARAKVLRLAGGRAGVLAAVRNVQSTLGAPVVEDACDRAPAVGDLLALLAAALLDKARGGSLQALGLAVRLGYAHPALTSAVLGGGQPIPGPWLQCLEDGWAHVRTVWRAPLRASLDPGAIPSLDTLHRVADWLLREGAVEYAVPLYLELRDEEGAARAITGEADHLMDLGQWETLSGWLSQLPEDVLAAHPELLYYRAEMAAALGDGTLAWRWFGLASSRFAARGDQNGACRSALAASAVAAGRGDMSTARERAVTVGSLADAAKLPTLQMWSAWQQGRVALVAGDVERALASFCRAASSVPESGPASVAEPVYLADQLARQIQELRRCRDLYSEAQAALDGAERETLARLLSSVMTSPAGAGALLDGSGWSGIPLPLKVAGYVSRENLASPSSERRRDHFRSEPTEGCRSKPPAESRDEDRPAGAGDGTGVKATPSVLAVHLLGNLSVSVNDAPVGPWSSPRGRSLLAYLLTHRDAWQHREVLMEVFWPGSRPKAARNSLNVAMHGLRQTLRTASDVPLIVLVGSAYRIHPDVRVWVDVEEFDRRVELGQRHEAAGDVDDAMRSYESAAALCRGSFLADDPYEDWAFRLRERLQLAHLDTLDRLSRLYYGLGLYASASALCRQIISDDPCREGAHRRLMRCYTKQDQPHLALLQYRACAQVLDKELGLQPSAATVEVRDKIMHHKPV
jgi:DNA-binding SARP family transcriptional activator